MNRAIFGLLAFLLLNGVARAGGGPAELNQYDVPAEARWSPFFANMPTCDDGGVLSTISGRFGQTQQEFWNSQLAISGFDRVRRNRFPVERPRLYPASLLHCTRRDERLEGANGYL